jgi:hypothetical protein
LNPRGYGQGIGPGHRRKGRHGPSSCACDRGHKGHKHWDKIWAMCSQALQGNGLTVRRMNTSDGHTARRMEAMSAQRDEWERPVAGAASVQRGEWLIMKDSD